MWTKTMNPRHIYGEMRKTVFAEFGKNTDKLRVFQQFNSSKRNGYEDSKAHFQKTNRYLTLGIPKLNGAALDQMAIDQFNKSRLDYVMHPQHLDGGYGWH